MPSDMCVALVALDATVKVQKADGTERSIPFAEYHRLPGDMPEKDNNLEHGELITAIEIPKNNFAGEILLFKSPRPRKLCVRARFGCRRAGNERQAKSKTRELRWAAWRTNLGGRWKPKNS